MLAKRLDRRHYASLVHLALLWCGRGLASGPYVNRITSSLSISHCHGPGCPTTPRCRAVWRQIKVAKESATAKCVGGLHVERVQYYPLVPPNNISLTILDACAVVSNAGLLLSSGCGAAIDTNDAIWRANTPHLQGHVSDVGMRVTHRFINGPEARRFAWGDPGFENAMTIADMFSNHPHLRAVQRKARHVAGFDRVWLATSAHLRDLHPFWQTHVHNRSTQKHLKMTSGFYMLIHAASMCRVVNMFGFGMASQLEESKNATGATHSAVAARNEVVPTRPCHFWEHTSEARRFHQTAKRHDFNLEHSIFGELALSGTRPGICVREPPDH